MFGPITLNSSIRRGTGDLFPTAPLRPHTHPQRGRIWPRSLLQPFTWRSDRTCLSAHILMSYVWPLRSLLLSSLTGPRHGLDRLAALERFGDGLRIVRAGLLDPAGERLDDAVVAEGEVLRIEPPSST